MGLKDVLSKMKLVELDSAAGGEAAYDPSGGPAADLALPPLGATPRGAGVAGAGPRAAGVGMAGAGSRGPGQGPSVEELLASVPAPRPIDEKKLPADEGGGVGIPDFPDIFKAAGITEPAHGYTAYKVLEILSSDGFSGLDPKSKAAALGGFLKMNPSGPVPLADIIQDAVRRDQALDKFEEFLKAKLQGRNAEVEKENAKLQAEIDQLTLRNREKMEQNRQSLAGERGKIERWQAVKRLEEKKLFDAVSPFVESNPVSLGPAAATTAPAAAPSPGPAVPPAGRNNG